MRMHGRYSNDWPSPRRKWRRSGTINSNRVFKIAVLYLFEAGRYRKLDEDELGYLNDIQLNQRLREQTTAKEVDEELKNFRSEIQAKQLAPLLEPPKKKIRLSSIAEVNSSARALKPSLSSSSLPLICKKKSVEPPTVVKEKKTAGLVEYGDESDDWIYTLNHLFEFYCNFYVCNPQLPVPFLRLENNKHAGFFACFCVLKCFNSSHSRVYLHSRTSSVYFHSIAYYQLYDNKLIAYLNSSAANSQVFWRQKRCKSAGYARGERQHVNNRRVLHRCPNAQR